MSRLSLYASTLVALALVTPAVFADPMVSLSSPNDLADLSVGQQVEIDVTLSGLAVGADFIFNLNTSILFPSSMFQTVPNAGNTSGLTTGFGTGFAFQFTNQPPNFYALSSLTPGNAIGIFADGPPAPVTPSTAINENGLYYSFSLKAIASGSGSIEFDSTPGANQYAADDTGFGFAPLPTGGPLSFSVSSVPEPSTLALSLVGTLAGLVYTRFRRR